MKNRRILSVLASSVLGVALVFSLAGCGPTAEEPVEEPVVEQPTEAPEAEVGTIVEVASADPQFSTLVAAIEAAGLAETLSGGEFTVFAPTNAAFDALPEGALDGLLADPEALAGVLTYHVIEGTVPAADVVGLDGQTVATVNGAEVSITVENGTVKVNGATVVVTDVMASNGIIHVIDAVLLP